MSEFARSACLVAIQAFIDPKNDRSRCSQFEEVATSQDDAVALLEQMIARERQLGMTVTFAAAHAFDVDHDGLVASIQSYYRVFEIQEPRSRHGSGGMGAHYDNPKASWEAKNIAEVAGTDSDGDGWFLRYHEVEVGEYWPADTIHEPQRSK